MLFRCSDVRGCSSGRLCSGWRRCLLHKLLSVQWAQPTRNWGFSPSQPVLKIAFCALGTLTRAEGFLHLAFSLDSKLLFVLVTCHAWAHFLELSAQIAFNIYSDLIFVYVHNWWSWCFSPISIQSAQAHLPAVHSKFHSVLNSSTWAHSPELKRFCSVCTWSFVCKYIIYITLKK